jgi:hypothetical protein
MEYEEGKKIKLKGALNWFVSLLYLNDIDDLKINVHVTNLKAAVNDYFNRTPEPKPSEIQKTFIDEFLKRPMKVHDFLDKLEECYMCDILLRKLRIMTKVNIEHVVSWEVNTYIIVFTRAEAEKVYEYLKKELNIKCYIESKPGVTYYPHKLAVTFDTKHYRTLKDHIEDCDYV